MVVVEDPAQLCYMRNGVDAVKNLVTNGDLFLLFFAWGKRGIQSSAADDRSAVG